MEELKIYHSDETRYAKKIEDFYIDHGVAGMAVKIRNISDLLSPYSVKGYETINETICEYMTDYVESIPIEYPICLQICGGNLGDEEKDLVVKAIRTYYGLEYNALLNKQKEENALAMLSFIMMICTLVCLAVFNDAGFLTEIIVTIFWFFFNNSLSDVVINYRVRKDERLKIARLACMDIVFTDEYIDVFITDEQREGMKKRIEEVMKGK